MASDPLQGESPISVATPPRACDKVRLRFRKGGDLRLVSHRDLMKCFERALRRAQLPVHVTQGFHPMPRMVFAMSLGLGIIGLEEVLELEFTQPVEPEEARTRLARQMPTGLEILSARRIGVKQSAQVCRAGYRIAVPDERLPGLPERIAALLAARELWVDRTRPQPRRFDLRPLLSDLRVHSTFVSPSMHIEMLLWVTPNGAARPGEVLALLGLDDLADTGAPLERHVLELSDEITQPGPLPEIHQATTAGPRDDAPGPARPTALISGPLSFDS
jgi:radical SAM-linked protein